MPMAQIMPGVPAGSAGVDPAYWPHDLSNGSLSPRTVQQSPGGYSSARDSVSQSITPTAQTPPQSDSSRKNSSVEGGQQNSQKNKLTVDASQRASVAVACVPCRSRHLKCDGGVRCSRCRADGVDCTYIKSRRGWKGKRKNKPEDQVSPVAINGAQTPHVPISNGHMVNGTIVASNGQLSSPNSYYNGETPIMNQLSPTQPLSAQVMPPPSAHAQMNLNGTQRMNKFGHIGPETAIQAFYYYFYNSHPFCLPEPRLLELFNQRKAPLLEYAVQYLGSSYLPAIPTSMYKEALDRYIDTGNFLRDGWSVQALLLYAIGLHANNEVPRAAQIFTIAQDLTLEIGLNRMEYALMHGESNPQIEECWRRTWWGMYCANGMLCAVNPGVQFRLKDVLTDVPLPCENDQYFSGVRITPLPSRHKSASFLSSHRFRLASTAISSLTRLGHR